ncbi:MAG: hypothetical protein ACD_28C00284G0003 [uncultured bacterium]|nr:MAG: hypothetical protein ACD_28C00284G0003 [uncultured bacterium]KKT72936.1 MAG: N-acetyl-gamma-glutamyl-phosphate reductase [Candidatus Peregrinibacteria bacterium GW2011_GWA2_44_7]
MSKTIKVSIFGAGGYIGLELIRLMQGHPSIELINVTSENHAGQKLNELWPHLAKSCELTLSNAPLEKIANESDCIFLALPHSIATSIVPQLIGKAKLIDLSQDFRGKAPFIYGVPEWNKKDIQAAQNIANPGCFAIGIELALHPIREWIEHVSVLGITGSSGAGKLPQEDTHHALRNHNLKSYKLGEHPHYPEILHAVGLQKEQLVFIPTKGPYSRGIHLTAFLEMKKVFSPYEMSEFFQKAYDNQPFIRLKKEVQLAEVVGSNFCDISVQEIHGKLVVQAVLDNLVKGAAGNALQNFNLMFGFEENLGLKQFTPLFP